MCYDVTTPRERDCNEHQTKDAAVKYFIANRIRHVEESIPYEIALRRMEDIIKEYDRLREENEELKKLLEKACIQQAFLLL